MDGAGSKHCRKTSFSFTHRPSSSPVSDRQEMKEAFESTGRLLTVVVQGTMSGEERKVLSSALLLQSTGTGQSCSAFSLLLCKMEKEEQDVLSEWARTGSLFPPST